MNTREKLNLIAELDRSNNERIIRHIIDSETAPPEGTVTGQKGNDMVDTSCRIYGCFDGENLIPALLVAAENNLMISGLKQKLVDGTPMYEVSFRVVKK